MNTKVTEDRQTPKSDFGARMKDGLATAAGAVATGIGVAAPLVPGGAIISAAVNGVTQLGGSLSSGQRTSAVGGGTSRAVGGTGTMPSSGSSTGSVANVAGDSYNQGIDLIQAQQASNMQFLTLQNQMQQENQKFSTLSNVIKVRHDTAKNSISNIR
ncbi:MAG TPA: hypothetical protein VGK67_38470 [Myxococcales bacterium]|jgi:hypothetical protein